MKLLGACATLAFGALPGLATAATVERNLPPIVQSHAALAAPNVLPNNASDVPIAGPLVSLTFLGLSDPIAASGLAPGVHATAVPFLDDPAFVARAQTFLGRPISEKLIADIEAAVATWYREKGQPFVSISTPPQEITGGTLQFRVIEFHLGHVAADAHGRIAPEQVLRAVRTPTGEPVNARQLAVDLDWLNRSPFREVTATFEPGAGLGETDLTLHVTETRPWQVFAGYANSGSEATDWNRYFVGAVLGDAPTIGSTISYQLTGSTNFWTANGVVPRPQYVSHAGRIVIPTLSRSDVEGTASYVETNTMVSGFDVRSRTLETTAAYRAAMPGSLRGEIVLGIEAKRQEVATGFGGVPVSDNIVTVYQGIAGWSDRWSDAFGRAGFGFNVHLSPGGLDANNTDAAFATATSGRVTEASYAYVEVDAMRTFRLPGAWGISTTASGQYSGQPLPDTEQMALGGPDAVRGYTSADGSFDMGIIARNELRAPSFDLGGSLMVSPFGLFDVGYVQNAGSQSQTAASVGAGVDVTLGHSATANLSAAYALRDAAATRAGQWRADIKVQATY